MLPTYTQTLDYLYTRLPMFSRLGAAAIKHDLTNTLALCEALGNPERRFKSIHIAGTNGKGSTSHMLAAIFQQAGYKTGLYTSPHLIDFRERIRIDGAMVPENFVVRFVAQNKEMIERIEPSFFEITVAMAFTAFAEANVDIAIVETGLGGRLDSTNVITPELSIVTNISLDHTDLLGKTIPEIAYEKAGIIKRNVDVIIGEQNEAALPVFKAQVEKSGSSRLYEAFSAWHLQLLEDGNYIADSPKTAERLWLLTDMKGSYQQQNIATVLTAVDALNNCGWKLTQNDVLAALQDVKGITGLRGRWDVWQQAPLIIADVAHNPAGLSAVMQDWNAVAAGRKHIIVGFVRDKDVQEALAHFPRDAHFHFCAADIPRALPANELSILANGLGLKGKYYTSVGEAVRRVRSELSADDALLITGSFFIVGEAMQAYLLKP